MSAAWDHVIFEVTEVPATWITRDKQSLEAVQVTEDAQQLRAFVARLPASAQIDWERNSASESLLTVRTPNPDRSTILDALETSLGNSHARVTVIDLTSSTRPWDVTLPLG